MKHYTKGSKINLNGREFEIVDIWFGQNLISEEKKRGSTVYYANLKDSKGQLWGPIGINITK
jgi:hypothetical protein